MPFARPHSSTPTQPLRAHRNPILFGALPLFLALPLSGMSDLQAQDAPPAYAMTNVVLHHHDGRMDSSSTIIWRDGVITAHGPSAAIPFDAYVIDGGDSLHVYPGFIDGLNTWGSPSPANGAPGSGRMGGGAPGGGSATNAPGNPTYERAGIQPERSSKDLKSGDKRFKEALEAGFTAGNLVPEGRMLPGTSDLVLNPGDFSPASLIDEATALVFRFEPAAGGWTSRAYPSTDMGVIARFKQLMYDATALKEHIDMAGRPGSGISLPERDPVLEALFPVLDGTLPVLFEAESAEDLQRFLTLRDEFGFKSILFASGHLTGMEGEISRRGLSVLTSFTVPEQPSWMAKEKEAEASADSSATPTTEKSEPEWKALERESFQARQAEAWRSQVGQIRRYLDAGIPVGYAGMGSKPQDAVKGMALLLGEGGLSEADLLSILTRTTSDILGAGDRLGTVRSGAVANLTVYDKPFTRKGAKVRMSVVNGHLIRH